MHAVGGAERGRVPVRVEKASGETVTMGFRPENISSQAQTGAPEAEGLADMADGAGATRKELTVLATDAKAAFANVLFSLTF